MNEKIEANHKEVIKRFKAIENEWIDKPLTAAQKRELSTILDVIRSKGQTAKWNTLKKILIDNGYLITDSRKTTKGKRLYVSIISIAK